MNVEENQPPVQQTTREEDELSQRASAPTLRDLRAWANELLAAIEAEPEAASPNGGFSRRED